MTVSIYDGLTRVPLTEHVQLVLHRTLRIPDDGGEYPLPPSLGLFPVHAVEELRRAPRSRRDAGGFVVPIHLREALWLGFNRASPPHAVSQRHG